MRMAGHDSIGTNTDEFLQVMTDIAGLKKAHGKQIWALAGISGTVQAMFEWMFRAGTTWQLDDAGKVTNVLMTDAFEQVMEFETRLWEAGAIHPDGIGGDLPDMFTQARSRSRSTPFPASSGTPSSARSSRRPRGRARFFVPPAVDGGDLVIQRDDGYWGIVAISAAAAEDEGACTSCEHHQLLALALRLRGGAVHRHRCQGVNYEFGKDHEIVGLNDEQADSDRLALQWLGAFNSPIYSIGSTLHEYVDNFRTTMESLISQTVPNPVAGIIAPSAATLNAKLDSINEDYRNGFVTGRRPLSEMQAYRDAWLKAGGQTLCDEYTEALDQAS